MAGLSGFKPITLPAKESAPRAAETSRKVRKEDIENKKARLEEGKNDMRSRNEDGKRDIRRQSELDKRNTREESQKLPKEPEGQPKLAELAEQARAANGNLSAQVKLPTET